MSAHDIVPAIYKEIVTDVIKNIKEEFISRGVEEHVLTELRQKWESKLVGMDVADFPSDFVTGGILPQEVRKVQVKSEMTPPQMDGPVPDVKIPQLDGDDEEDEEEPVAADEPDERLGSDLDSDDDDEDDEEFDNLIVCQFEKVSHVRNRWKCSLKDGIMHIDGKDYIFARATGDFEW